MSAWGRTCCLLVIEQLRHPEGREAELGEARRLLKRCDSVSAEEIARMAALLRDWPGPDGKGTE
jgi:hypothetical protein